MSAGFVALMRRYVVDYLLCQDPSVCAQIMEPDYVLHMADADLTPRDEAYVPAVVSQFALFPGMGMTVHDLILNGDRLAMRFSQHGASSQHGGRLAGWSGIGLYRWNGRRLTETHAIEDYEGRRLQLAGGDPITVDAPMLAPWDVGPVPPDHEAEAAVRAWLAGPTALSSTRLRYDAEPLGSAEPVVDAERVTVEDLLSAGRQVAYKATHHGRYTGGLAVGDELIGAPLALHTVGLLTVDADGSVSGHVVRGRGPARRQLLAASGTRRGAG